MFLQGQVFNNQEINPLFTDLQKKQRIEGTMCVCAHESDIHNSIYFCKLL